MEARPLSHSFRKAAAQNSLLVLAAVKTFVLLMATWSSELRSLTKMPQATPGVAAVAASKSLLILARVPVLLVGAAEGAGVAAGLGVAVGLGVGAGVGVGVAVAVGDGRMVSARAAKEGLGEGLVAAIAWFWLA